MIKKQPTRIIAFVLVVLAMAALVLPAVASKVYILAGQSNMVGMGEIRGARCRYIGIYLTADSAAPKGPLYIYPVGNYKIGPLGVYVSADANADAGAMASVYAGAYNPAGSDGFGLCGRLQPGYEL